MRILVTNDDGIDSTGLHVLARRLAPLGDVLIVAPDTEYSGFGAALGTLHTMHPEVHQVDVDGVAEAWEVTGPPALCVYFARLGAFGPIDLVVAGINPGVNTGRSIYHSGTVGAVLTARNGGMSGVAISQNVTGFGVEGQGWDEMLQNQQWETAAEVGAAVAGAVLADFESDLEPAAINVNVPNCALDEIQGWRHAEVGTLPPRAVADAKLVPKLGHDRAYIVEMEWGDPIELPAETDGGTVERDLVSVTHLSRFARVDRPDFATVDMALDRLLG
ncbi:MAG: 5'/3'-nucleotidase SurE [Acidimicrobiales bacterium]